ncbi:Hypothetical protein A7982_05933 [Minicystis rosea]|nr:Hypothetical protein A7982_05933 [Minicystis rosea]
MSLIIRFMTSLSFLTAVILGVACNSSVDTATGGQNDTDSPSSGTGGAFDGGTDADSGSDGECPDWAQNKPGASCNVAEGKECGADSGWSFIFVRCCDGHWLAGDGGDSSASPPCP